MGYTVDWFKNDVDPDPVSAIMWVNRPWSRPGLGKNWMDRSHEVADVFLKILTQREPFYTKEL